MIISHVKISTSQRIINHILYSGYFVLVEKTVVYMINRKICACMEIPDLFLVLILLNMISHAQH